MIVVGNKLDLASDRAVMVEEGRHLANTFNAPFVEVSVKLTCVCMCKHGWVGRGTGRSRQLNSTGSHIFAIRFRLGRTSELERHS